MREQGEVPQGVATLATENFQRELRALRRSVRFQEYAQIEEQMKPSGVLNRFVWAVGNAFLSVLAPLDKKLEDQGLLERLRPSKQVEAIITDGPASKLIRENQTKLDALTLSNEACWAREHQRRDAYRAEGRSDASPVVLIPYLSVCVILDFLFSNRPIQRFWMLETVARMPYFAYTSCLHLYESFGWWRAGAELRKIHNAEEYNELHHLLIMESLGGDKNWVDRFLAHHAALVYYWFLVFLYMVNPRASYEFSELVEEHATDTYSQFLEENASRLKGLPAPRVAVDYYSGADLYLFDAFQTSEESVLEQRRPEMNNLYDVFSAVRDDEEEHIKTMKSCKDRTIQGHLKEQKRLREKQLQAQGILQVGANVVTSTTDLSE